MYINLELAVSKIMEAAYKEIYQEKWNQYSALRKPLKEIELAVATKWAQRNMLTKFEGAKEDIAQLETEIDELSEKYIVEEKNISEAGCGFLSQIAWLREKAGIPSDNV